MTVCLLVTLKPQLVKLNLAAKHPSRCWYRGPLTNKPVPYKTFCKGLAYLCVFTSWLYKTPRSQHCYLAARINFTARQTRFYFEKPTTEAEVDDIRVKVTPVIPHLKFKRSGWF